jgi:hypothetical protein
MPIPRTIALAALSMLIVTAAGSAAETATARYAIHVANSGAGGGGAVFHTGSPINITVIDHDSHAQRPVTICMTPAPIDRPSCHRAHTNRTLASLAPSRAGPTKITATLPGGATLVHVIHVKAGPPGR